jgi:hypothetical protein
MNNVRALYAFTIQDLSNGIMGAEFGVFLPFQPWL